MINDKKKLVLAWNWCIALLVFIGFIVVLSAASVRSVNESGSYYLLIIKQIVWLSLGLLAYSFFKKLDKKFALQVSILGVMLSFVLLLVLYVPGIGVEILGARRWIDLKFFTIQPAEFAKLAFLFYAANAVRKLSKQQYFFQMTALFFAYGLLFYLQPDFDGLVVLGLIYFSSLFFSGLSLKLISKMSFLIAAPASVLMLSAGYRRERFLELISKSKDAKGSSYQIYQAMGAFKNGGLFGRGLGRSILKWNWLPSADSDFVFAIIAEELGLVGAFTIICLFLALAILGYSILRLTKDLASRVIIGVGTIWITFQAFLNIASVLGILPVLGLTLPFISNGGTSLVVFLALCGMISNASGEAVAKKPKLKLVPAQI